jgi:hypothetical protein
MTLDPENIEKEIRFEIWIRIDIRANMEIDKVYKNINEYILYNTHKFITKI